MNAETLVGLGATALPIAAGAAGAVNWVYRVKRQRRADADQHAADEEEKDGAEFTRLRSANAELDRQLRELTPRLSEIRREYTDAIQQCIQLLDQLRKVTEENNRLTTENVDQRIELTRAIKSQKDHIDLLRAQMLLAGMDIPPLPDIDSIVKRFTPAKET